jgi:crotonobetainyl-CoA:carnitine CoA-transferase CaiB-like acyl-CoA transferase
MAFNRHKESIKPDLETPSDREILDAILEAGDILFETFRSLIMAPMIGSRQ